MAGMGAINIVLDDIEDQPATFFVEIENDKGESISIGTSTKRDDGLRYLRITAEEIMSHLKI